MNWSEINANRNRSCEKYRFFLGDYDFNDFSKGKIAKQLPKSHVGWGARAIEMRSNKTTFDCFENDDLKLTGIMERYHIYEALEKVQEDVLVAGCAFLGLVGDTVLPFTAQEATGTFNWREQALSFGAAVFSGKTREAFGTELSIPEDYVIYEPNRTRIKRADSPSEEIIANPTGRPLMGVLTYRSSVKRPFGKAVLNHSARDAIIDASRTNRQAMLSAYYYNSKVDVLLGVDADTDIDRVEGQTGDTLTISPNEQGETPKIGEFAQHAMTPFEDTILIAARNFCTATKLTLANLGISSDAPQSPEALEIVSDDLRDDIARWQHELGEELKRFCLTLFMHENKIDKIDQNLLAKFNATISVFRPTYRSDLAKIGDGIYKLAEKAPGILYSRSLWRNLGLTSKEIDEVIASVGTAQV